MKGRGLSRRGLVNRWKGEVSPSPFIGLRSEHDKSVYFWSLGSYFLYNAIITRNNKQKLTLFSFLTRQSAVRHLVYFVNSRSDIYANKSYEISSLSIYFIVKLNWNRRVVCLRDVVSTSHQMTSRNVLYWRRWRIRSRCVQWKSKCDLYLVSWDALYFVEQINVIFMRPTPLRKQIFCVIALSNTLYRRIV